MSLEFLVLKDDRLLIRGDAITAVTELGEEDIDRRTGRLALGIPEGAVAVIHTARQTFYVKTTYDDILQVILETVMEKAELGELKR